MVLTADPPLPRSDVGDNPRPDDKAGRRGWGAALLTFALLLGLSTAWILATPPNGGPDEAHHAVKAAAVVSGQLTGDLTDPPDGGARVVEVPRRIGALHGQSCFAFQPQISASCLPTFRGSSEVGPVPTNAGVSPPLYYALVGAPLRLLVSLDGFYLSRLLSAAIACALVAAAVRVALAARSRFLAVGVLVSWTPMAVSLTGIISPSSLELGAATAVWVTGILLARPGSVPDDVRARLPWLFALTASLFVLSRQLSPVFLVCIVVCLALAASPGRLRALLSDRSVRLPAAFTTLATVVGAAWFLAVPPGASAIDPPVTYEGRQLLSVPLGRFGQFYQQMIGVFGWLDTRPPLVVLLVWTMAVGALVVLGVTLGRRRVALAIVLCAGLAVLVSTLVEASQLNDYGILFQGRYILPLAMGVVMLAARAVDEVEAAVLTRLVPLTTTLLALVVVGHAVSLYMAARRFSVSVNGPLNFLWAGGWDPGVPPAAIVALGIGSILALAFTVGRACRLPVDVARAASAPARDHDDAGVTPVGDPRPATTVS